MSEDNLQVEQITKEPEKKTERIKDPKKVAAGKRLAEYHKKAKQALKKESEKENDEIDGDDSNNKWVPEISLTTALTIIGIGLTSLDLYLRWRKDNETTTKLKKDNEEPKIPTPSSMNELQLAPKPITSSKIPRKIGME